LYHYTRFFYKLKKSIEKIEGQKNSIGSLEENNFFPIPYENFVAELYAFALVKVKLWPPSLNWDLLAHFVSLFTHPNKYLRNLDNFQHPIL